MRRLCVAGWPRARRCGDSTRRGCASTVTTTRRKRWHTLRLDDLDCSIASQAADLRTRASVTDSPLSRSDWQRGGARAYVGEVFREWRAARRRAAGDRRDQRCDGDHAANALEEASSAAAAAIAAACAVLEGGVEVQADCDGERCGAIQRNAAQLTRRLRGSSACRRGRVGDMTNANYSNMEAGELAYVDVDARSLLRMLGNRAAARRADDAAIRAIHHHASTARRLIRNDVKSLHESLAVGRNTGIYSIERLPAEARRESDSRRR